MTRTSSPAVLPRVDGRSAPARRYQKLVTAFSRDLGDDLNEADRALIASAAMAALRIETLRAQILSGEIVDDGQLTRLLNSSARLLGIVSGKAKMQMKRPVNLADYLKGDDAT